MRKQVKHLFFPKLIKPSNRFPDYLEKYMINIWLEKPVKRRGCRFWRPPLTLFPRLAPEYNICV